MKQAGIEWTVVGLNRQAARGMISNAHALACGMTGLPRPCVGRPVVGILARMDEDKPDLIVLIACTAHRGEIDAKIRMLREVTAANAEAALVGNDIEGANDAPAEGPAPPRVS